MAIKSLGFLYKSTISFGSLRYPLEIDDFLQKYNITFKKTTTKCHLYFNKLEDYNIWKPHLEYIRSFYHIKEKNTEDLVIHLRAIVIY